MNPVCSRCKFLSTNHEKFRPCPKIPIFHRDMCCSNEKNTIKDHVSGTAYTPYCEEVNRHGECLEYIPTDLSTPAITFVEEDNLIKLTGTSPFVYTTDGTTPTAKVNNPHLKEGACKSPC